MSDIVSSASGCDKEVVSDEEKMDSWSTINWQKRREDDLKAKELYIRNRVKYPWCCFCGSEENVVHRKDMYNTYHDFCRDSRCSLNYEKFVYSDYVDMTNGIPTVYMKLHPERMRKVEEPRKDKKGVPLNLTCDYCGSTSDKVITNISMVNSPHANFCKNFTCCRMYRNYLERVPRIPHAFTVTRNAFCRHDKVTDMECE